MGLPHTKRLLRTKSCLTLRGCLVDKAEHKLIPHMMELLKTIRLPHTGGWPVPNVVLQLKLRVCVEHAH